MTDFTNEEMRDIILRVLEENAAHMAEKYGIPRNLKPKRDKPAEAAREPALTGTK